MTLSFGLSHVGFTLTTVTVFFIQALAREMYLAGLTPTVAAPVDLFFGLTLIVATPEVLLALYAKRFSLKLLSCFPVSVLLQLVF